MRIMNVLQLFIQQDMCDNLNTSSTTNITMPSSSQIQDTRSFLLHPKIHFNEARQHSWARGSVHSVPFLPAACGLLSRASLFACA